MAGSTNSGVTTTTWALVMGAGLIVAAITATVVLIVTGHANEAYTVPAVVISLVPFVFSQARIATKVDAATHKVEEMMNGGTEAALERVIDRKVTPVAALSDPATVRAIVSIIRPDDPQPIEPHEPRPSELPKPE